MTERWHNFLLLLNKNKLDTIVLYPAEVTFFLDQRGRTYMYVQAHDTVIFFLTIKGGYSRRVKHGPILLSRVH